MRKKIALRLAVILLVLISVIVCVPVCLIWTGALDYTKGSARVLGITLWRWYDLYLYGKNIAIGALVVLIAVSHSLRGHQILAPVNFGILLSALTNDLPMMMPWRFALSCILISCYTLVTVHKLKKQTMAKAYLVSVLVLSVIYWTMTTVRVV